MPRTGALAHCHHDTGLSSLLVYLLHPGDRLFVHCAGDQYGIGMTHRADKLHTKTLNIEPRSETIQDLNVAIVTGTDAAVKYPE